MSCCCNCLKCVDRRGGLLSYSQHCGNLNPQAKDESPSLRPASCTCSLRHILSSLPIKIRFLTAWASDYFSVVLLHYFEIEDWALELDDFPADFDRPG